jgi:hypothetical protein
VPQQLFHAREEPRVDADVLRVDLEELLAHRLELRVLDRDAEGRDDHAARAMRDERAHLLERHGLEAAAAAHLVHGVRHVGRGVDERAIEIEEDRLKHAGTR